MPEGRHWLLVWSMESRVLFSYLSYRRHPDRSYTVGFGLILILGARRFLRARICDDLRMKDNVLG